ncbi:hypothetical protein AMECASPLE_029158 [Ameca splendens]|uniref:Fringe-like glycosyltransferase domain-containing protein n=1 Tax=Ameca splendens TaxID=208324 RepID=A0ABV0XUJ5_9TELE
MLLYGEQLPKRYESFYNKQREKKGGDTEGAALVTLSYGGFQNRRNVVSIVGGFSLAEDPTRFKTVHCLLYPDTQWCPKFKSGHKN